MSNDSDSNNPESYLERYRDDIRSTRYNSSEHSSPPEQECKTLRKIAKQKIKFFPKSHNSKLLNSLYIDGYPIRGYLLPDSDSEGNYKHSLGCLDIMGGSVGRMQCKSVIGILLEIANGAQTALNVGGEIGPVFYYEEIVPCIVNLPSPEDPIAEEIFNHLVHFILTKAEKTRGYVERRMNDPYHDSEYINEKLKEHAENGKWGLTKKRDESFSFEPCKANVKNVIRKILNNYRYIDPEEISDVVKEINFRENLPIVDHVGKNLSNVRYFEASDKVLDIEGFKTFYPLFKLKTNKENELLLSEIPYTSDYRDVVPIGALDMAILLASNLEYAPTVQWCNYKEELVKLVNPSYSVHNPTYTAGRFYAHMMRFVAENLYKIEKMRIKPIENHRGKRNLYKKYRWM